jgi:hypothetical protein
MLKIKWIFCGKIVQELLILDQSMTFYAKGGAINVRTLEKIDFYKLFKIRWIGYKK